LALMINYALAGRRENKPKLLSLAPVGL
jgi:hypothetical protein